MNPLQINIDPHTLPITLSVFAHFLLGASSLYWKELGEVTPTTLVAYRIILSAFILSLFILLFRRPDQQRLLKPRIALRHLCASFFIAANWAAFIWPSINGYILESALGYLLAPFISITLGVTLYHDPINAKKTASILTALCCIAALILLTENLNHWIYLVIAATWGLYTYIKKATPLNAEQGLLLETVFLSLCLPPAVLLFDLKILYPHELPTQAINLIWLAGAVSTAPLLMFSYAAGKIPLSLTGLLQFTLPFTLITISFTAYEQKAPPVSLAIIITTTTILATLIIYDTVASRRPKQGHHT